MITTIDAWNRIAAAGGIIFSVTFRRKHPKIDRETKQVVEPAGSLRKMTCRRGVRKHTQGIIPPGVRLAEDVRCNVLTVWDIEFYHERKRELRQQGVPAGVANMRAGRAAYRRINMAEVVEISLPETEVVGA